MEAKTVNGTDDEPVFALVQRDELIKAEENDVYKKCTRIKIYDIDIL